MVTTEKSLDPEKKTREMTRTTGRQISGHICGREVASGRVAVRRRVGVTTKSVCIYSSLPPIAEE